MKLLVMKTDKAAIVFLFFNNNKCPFVFICVLVELQYFTANIKVFFCLLNINLNFFSRV
jgi:hypothetical protein